MSLQVGVDPAGSPVYMWELSADVLRKAAKIQRLRDDLDKALKARDEHTANVDRLFRRRRPRLRSLERLDKEVRLARVRLANEIGRQENPPSLADAANEAALAFDRFARLFQVASSSTNN